MSSVSWTLGISQHPFLFIIFLKKIPPNSLCLMEYPLVQLFFIHPKALNLSVITLAFLWFHLFTGLYCPASLFLYLLKSLPTYIFRGIPIKSLFLIVCTQKWSIYWQNAFFIRCDKTNEIVFKYQCDGADTLEYREKGTEIVISINILLLMFLLHIHGLCR